MDAIGMTDHYSALIAFAPIVSGDRYDNPDWQARTMLWGKGSLRLIPGKTVPVLLDHDPGCVLRHADQLAAGDVGSD